MTHTVHRHLVKDGEANLTTAEFAVRKNSNVIALPNSEDHQIADCHVATCPMHTVIMRPPRGTLRILRSRLLSYSPATQFIVV